MTAHVTTGCRDCKKCTNSGVANLGRNAGRVGVGIYTLGISELVMSGTKNCRVCGHKLSLHTGEDYAQPKPSKTVPAGWYMESGRMRWWDGVRWTDQYQDSQPTTTVATDALSRLIQHHQSGALTDEEFTAAKAKLLGL